MLAWFHTEKEGSKPIHQPSTNDARDADVETVRRLRQRLEEKDQELERLRSELVRNAGRTRSVPLGERPVFFVVGRAKSGTSWLMRMLDSHPEIMCKGEGRFFGRGFIQEDFEGGQEGRVQPSSLYRALLEADYLRGWIERSVWTRRDDAEEHLINLMRLSTDYFLSQRLSKSGKRIVGDKTPFLGDAILEEIGRIYPEARVLHIIRDGRDAAVSMLHHMWNNCKDEGGIYELKPEELAKREAYRRDSQELIETGEGLFSEEMLSSLATGWRDQVSKSMRDGRALLGDNYAEVRYEDLLRRPEEEVGRLLRFLGADAGEGSVRRCVEAGNFERWTRGRGRGEEESSSFFRKGVAGDWRGTFTERDKRGFKEIAGDLLVELGYEKDRVW